MKVLIITYDLINPGKNYEDLLKEVKRANSWARLGGSSYLIYTDKTVVQERDRLQKVLDKNDKLYVGVSPAPSAWIGLPAEVSTWLHQHQK